MDISSTSDVVWDHLVCYDESSPTCLRWKVERRTGGRGQIVIASIGSVAGGLLSDGYYGICLRGKIYRAHRIVWELKHGPICPSSFIDHINGDKTWNAISNLRECDHKVNCRNKKMPCANTSGVVGVSRATDKRNGIQSWRAQWNDLSGTMKMKSFSCNKYGDTEAFQLACEHRDAMIQKLNQQGAGYTGRHGT